MARQFKAYNPNQKFLLPPDLRDWLPLGHLALFISDLVDNQLDLAEVFASYEHATDRGQPPYHPSMMMKLLLYGYAVGIRSSRRIERATQEDIAFRVLSANQTPDHDSIAAFRKRHLGSIESLFSQVLLLCQEAGMVKLGNVAVDGTKMKANASRLKTKEYGKLEKRIDELRKRVRQILEEAERVDKEEDRIFGKGKRGDELPAELRTTEGRLKKLKEAKEALERQAREEAEEKNKEFEEKKAERRRYEEKHGKKPQGGSLPQEPVAPEKAVPKPDARYNLTDPDSRVMKTAHGFKQAYNAQIAVDTGSQVILSALITQEGNDKHQLIPVLKELRKETGTMPEAVCADAGYFSQEQILDELLSTTTVYIPPGEHRNGGKHAQLTRNGVESVAWRMEQIMETDDAKDKYSQRQGSVEPVFGRTKAARGIDTFLLRGLEKVTAEWKLVCLTHNLLKLWGKGAFSYA